jgi:hypothetical protein
MLRMKISTLLPVVLLSCAIAAFFFFTMPDLNQFSPEKLSGAGALELGDYEIAARVAALAVVGGLVFLYRRKKVSKK